MLVEVAVTAEVLVAVVVKVVETVVTAVDVAEKVVVVDTPVVEVTVAVSVRVVEIVAVVVTVAVVVAVTVVVVVVVLVDVDVAVVVTELVVGVDDVDVVELWLGARNRRILLFPESATHMFPEESKTTSRGPLSPLTVVAGADEERSGCPTTTEAASPVENGL